MDEKNIDNVIGLHLRGEFLFIGHQNSGFVGPIKKGLRLMLWGNSNKRVTSCSFVRDFPIKIGEKGYIEIVIASAKAIDKKIDIGQTYVIGTPEKKLGEFLITEIIGEWIGKVP